MAESASPSSQVHAGVDALRAAALALIGAARTFLDVAEAVVADPHATREVAENVTRVMKGIADLVVKASHPAPAPEAPVVEEIPVRAKPRSRSTRSST